MSTGLRSWVVLVIVALVSGSIGGLLITVSARAWSVPNAMNLGLLCVAFVGFIAVWYQIKQNYRTQKATFFKELYLEMFKAGNIRKAYYQIEYEQFVYDNGFHGSEQEQVIDRLMAFVDLVCDLYYQNMLTEHEMSFFKYEFLRIYQNPNIRDYLAFLREWYTKIGTDTQPFSSFTAYCEQALGN